MSESGWSRRQGSAPLLVSLLAELGLPAQAKVIIIIIIDAPIAGLSLLKLALLTTVVVIYDLNMLQRTGK